MDIHHLKIFVSVYQNSSFSKASTVLNISQPTISEHIKNLESELDCKLFDRLGRSIMPTAEAEAILPHALQVIEDLNRVRDALDINRGQVAGPLVIGASTIPGTYLLPGLAAAFKKLNPLVSFELRIHDTAQVAELVAGHQLFMGVVGAQVKNRQLTMTPFFQDELVCAAHPTLARQIKGPDDLSRLPFLLREKGSGTRRMMEGFLKEEGIDYRDFVVGAVLGSTAAIKEGLKAGLGISILSKKAISEELEQGRLQEISIFSAAMVRDFFILTHKKRTLPGSYQSFVDQLLRQ